MTGPGSSAVHARQGGDEFGRPPFIESYAADMFGRLHADGLLRGLDVDQFAAKAGDLLADVNTLHAYREGTWRTQRGSCPPCRTGRTPACLAERSRKTHHRSIPRGAALHARDVSLPVLDVIRDGRRIAGALQ